ncbi:ATP-binding protein [Mycobacterium paraffinicum]|nr:LuxR C-terminal-related transcriptional regulator [Mycobacterium paraffinicum]
MAHRGGRGNLPAEVSGFIGRREAIADLKRMLGTARLITLIGPGGVGKTRLATRVARSVARAYPDGTWLAQCGDLREPVLLGHLVVSALEITDRALDTAELTIRNHLANRRLALVLDSCDHLIDASAKLVNEILHAAPDVQVIATSREPLCVPGEHIYRVLPFPVADLSRCRQSSAHYDDSAAPDAVWRPSSREVLDLFEQRAVAADPDFRITASNEDDIAHLCAHLDGLPLAIELAAARVRSMTPQKMLEHLHKTNNIVTSRARGSTTRHQTLRSLIDWSYDLCSQHQRLLWVRSSVFPGSFDLDAAAAICGDDSQSRGNVIETMIELVDKSIVTRENFNGRDRYRLLETLRHYGAERLDPADGDRIRRRHRDYFASLVEHAEANFSAGTDQQRWASALDDELANLRGALEFSLGPEGEAGAALDIATRLWFVWVRGAAREGSYWLDRALTTGAGAKMKRAQALCIRAWIAALQGDQANGRVAIEHAQAIAGDLDDEHLWALVAQACGEVAFISDDLTAAVTWLERAASYYRRAGEWSAITLLSLAQLGWIKGLQGDHQGGATLGHECRTRSESCGNDWSLSWAYWVLGTLAWTSGDHRLAETQIIDSLTIRTEIHDWLGIPFALELLAWICQREEPRRSARLLGVNESLWDRIGLPLFGSAPLTAVHRKCCTELREALGDDAFTEAFDLGARLNAEESLMLALRRQRESTPRNPGLTATLTRREQEIAQLVAQGLSNREVATALVISQRTAESHVHRILLKLGFTSRTQIALAVINHQAATIA